ncbi:heme/hemin ABC transporter substrate-binding protein [Chromobacterium phragmitis]|uniref:heme/hemin ABC transporter substrate-binding protein n=1 Tax=Chromobacterium phragmitis TaxID=2202141 RepID=UPI003877E01C
MSLKSWIPSLLLAALPLAAPAAERVVVLTPDIAEIVVALGAGGEVIGRDRDSKQPELARAQVVGFSRALSAETIAGLKPTLVLGSAAAKPAALWPQLARLKLRAEEVSAREDGRDFADAIRKVGALLGRDAAAGKLADDWQRKMLARPARAVRYLVSYDGSLVAGRRVDAAGGADQGVGRGVAAGLSGFKPLNRDAWQALKPDVIILGSHTAAAYGGKDAFSRRPEVAATPAGKQGRIYQLPPQQGMLIGLGSPAVVERMVKM